MVAGADRHRDAGGLPPVDPGPDREHDPVLRRRLVRAGRDDEPGLADPVGLELLYDNPVEERPELLAHAARIKAAPAVRPGLSVPSPPMPAARRRRPAHRDLPLDAARRRGARLDRRGVLGQPGPRRLGGDRGLAGRRARGALRQRAAHDEQPDGVHRGARGAARAAGGQPRLHRDRLAADARLDDQVDRRLEAQGLEDGGRRARQEPGPGQGARRRARPPRQRAGTGSAGTRPAPRTRTRRSTTARTASPSRPRAQPPERRWLARRLCHNGSLRAF